MRKFPAFLLLALLAGTFPPAAFADTALTASVDKSTVAEGERFTLTLTFSGARDMAAPDLSSLPNFKVHYIGPITRMQTSNARVEMSVSHRYLLTAPQHTGRYTIGPLRIVVNAQALETQPITITVKTANGTSSGRAQPLDVELQVLPEVKNPWVGQRVPVIVRLRVGNTRVDDLNYPSVSVAGATVEDFGKPSRRDEWDNGQRFQILDFKTTLTPLKSGPIGLKGVSMDMTVLDPSANSRRHAVFDDFFSSGRRRSLRLKADPVRLDVRPLPADARPANFSGAIGTFDFRVEAGPTELAVGDPITLRTKIVGIGNLESLVAPAVSESDAFRVYEPTLVSGDMRAGTVTFEQVLIPKNRTAQDVPPLSFAFFDPHDGTYQVSQSAPIPIQINDAAPQLSGIISSEAEPRIAIRPAELGKDIVYIKERPGEFSKHSTDRSWNPTVLALQGVPVLIFLLTAAFTHRRSAMFADPRAHRARQSGGIARNRLKAIATQHENSADELTEIVAEYLCARLGLPPGQIDKEHVLPRLKEIGAGNAAVQAVERFFTALETVRYGGSISTNDAGTTARSLGEDIVTSLEKDRNVTKSVLLSFVLILSLAGAVVHAKGDPEMATPAVQAVATTTDPMEAFFLGNGAYADANYAKAEQAYRSALASGVESAALYFNLGNACFKQRKIGAAIAAYENSLRLAPRDPDVAANIEFAREQVDARGIETATAERYLTPLATRMTISELTAATTVLWWLTWLLTAIATAVAETRFAMRRMAIVATLLFVVFGANLAVRYHHTVWQQWVVVTTPGETAVRFEPSADGTEHYSISEGGMLEARRTRKGWIQVRREDGRRGWIPASSAQRL